jgi:hypothetical protein
VGEHKVFVALIRTPLKMLFELSRNRVRERHGSTRAARLRSSELPACIASPHSNHPGSPVDVAPPQREQFAAAEARHRRRGYSTRSTSPNSSSGTAPINASSSSISRYRMSAAGETASSFEGLNSFRLRGILDPVVGPDESRQETTCGSSRLPARPALARAILQGEIL